MYSRHRVAGYSIDHVIKFLFFLLVPVVILDIMISCFVIFSMRSQSIQSLQDTTKETSYEKRNRISESVRSLFYY